MKVFVYGSLKKGFHNHRLLEDGNAEFLHEAKTRPEFSMWSLGSFPGVTLTGDTAISGEVYEVDKQMLKRLDYLEGYPSFYNRTEIDLNTGERALMYFLPNTYDRCEKVEDGVWRRGS